MSTHDVPIVLTNAHAKIPKRYSDGAAAYDLYSTTDVVLCGVNGLMMMTFLFCGSIIVFIGPTLGVLSMLLMFVFFPSTTKVIPTGIKIKIPPGHYGSIRGRSSLSRKGIHVGGGIIDEDYTGEILVMLYCLDSFQKIHTGDRIAQLIIEPYVTVKFVQVKKLEEEQKGGRGEKGFGSTGLT